MKKRTFGSLLCLAAMTSSCSTYPLPQDVASDDTYSIVAKVRCEVRDALRGIIVAQAERIGSDRFYGKMSGIEFARSAAENPNFFKDLKVELLANYEFRRQVEYYQTSMINYDFSLQGTESNIQGFRAGLARTMPREVDSLGFGLEADRTREVKRLFEISDHAISLVQNVEEGYCLASRNLELVYPMGGQKKIRDLIESYILINMDPSLKGSNETPNIRSMGDTIYFKTRISGDVTPGFAFTPLGTGLTFTSLGFTNKHYREEQHRVIVTISTSPVSEANKRTPRSARLLDGKAAPPEAQRKKNGAEAIETIRGKNFQDAVIDLSNSLNRMAR